MAEWCALPEVCLFDGCPYTDIDHRGPIFLRDGSIHKACVEHWEAVHGIIGRSVGSNDEMRCTPDDRAK